MGTKNTIIFIFISLIYLSGCQKFQWNNPYDPECPKELFTPSSPGATMEGNSVKLTWSQQNDDISGFALFRSTEGESITNLTQTQKSTTQYIDANITPGKKYTYYIVAVAGTNKSDTVKADIIPVIPITISTGAVTELAATSAKVSGNITNAGGGTVTSRGICWSITPNPTVNNSKTTEGTGAGQFTSILTNLLAATTYYARAYGENSRGVSYGSEVTFTTLGPPKLTTTAVSNITATSATSGGTIIGDGGSPITAKGVVWSTSPSPTIALATKTDDGTGVGAFTSTMSNLTNNTKYFFRAYATNIVGTTYGEEFSFTAINPIEEKLKQGLLAYFPFNGNANDESGNGNNGVVNGAALTTDRKNIQNTAYSFNGSSSWIEADVKNIPLGNTPRSFSFWAKQISIPISNIPSSIFHYGNIFFNQRFCVLYWVTIPTVIAQANDACYNCNGSTNNSNIGNIFSEWNHVAIIFDGANLSCFVNGVLYFNANKTYNTQLTSFIIGRANPQHNTGEYFSGQIDDIRIYNRALTLEEITYLANN